MMRSLYSAVAGLKNHQTKMDVIGNNISNVNTVAFKSSSVTFSDIIYQTISGASGANANLGGVNAKQIGLGMATAATSMSITGSGSAQTTGKPFDLRINDSGNTTNFFVVNNGTENVYTRDGCFYIDGAGTLCMDSTGYRVMGYGVNPENGEITKGELVPMTIMETKNLTSDPEATEDAYAAGIIDKDTPDLNSTAGYTMELTIYDDRGYPYSCRFTVKNYKENDDGLYKIRLSQILDQNGVDQLAIAKAKGVSMQKIFGDEWNTGALNIDNGTPYQTTANLSPTGTQASPYQDKWSNKQLTSAEIVGKPYIGCVHHDDGSASGLDYYYSSTGDFYNKDGSVVTTPPVWSDILKGMQPWASADNTVNITGSSAANTLHFEATQIVKPSPSQEKPILKENWYFVDQTTAPYPVTYNGKEYPNPTAGTVTPGLEPGEEWAGYFVNLKSDSFYAVTSTGRLYAYDESIPAYVESATGLSVMLQDYDPDSTSTAISGRTIVSSYVDYTMAFSTADGSLQSIGEEQAKQWLKLADSLGANFKNVEIDFHELKNVNNGKKSTANFDTGVSATDTTGTGKKLGNLTGVAVQNDGKIYGSYDNGNTVLLGQIAAAHFANASGLEKIGESCYNTTLNSGEAVIGDISADGSSMTSGEIEMSNVDLSAEFTDMITTQRGFQANSRVITTSDTLLEELINLKR